MRFRRRGDEVCARSGCLRSQRGAADARQGKRRGAQVSNLPVQQGRAVYITYTIRNGEGEVLEQYDLPVGYVHGADSGLIEPLERALDGRAAGDLVEVEVPPEDAFGLHDPALVIRDRIDNVPAEYRRAGAEAVFQNERGDTRTFRVTQVDSEYVTLDGNHPLAGVTLTYSIKVVAVREATAEERALGRPMDAASGALH